MVERGLLKPGYLEIAALMFSVAGAALLSRNFRITAMEAAFVLDIAPDIFVACLALGIFRRWSEGQMAGSASGLQIGMDAAQRSRRDEPLERGSQDQEYHHPHDYQQS